MHGYRTTTHRQTPTREPIDPALFARLSARVTADEDVDAGTADRIVGQALAFLQVCALNPDARLAPSKTVDAGWHAFLLHTRGYSEFCHRIAGRFIHHRPDEGDNEDGAAAVEATVAAMRAAGLPVDAELWTCGAKCNGTCSQCYAGCVDDPNGGA